MSRRLMIVSETVVIAEPCGRTLQRKIDSPFDLRSLIVVDDPVTVHAHRHEIADAFAAAEMTIGAMMNLFHRATPAEFA